MMEWLVAICFGHADLTINLTIDFRIHVILKSVLDKLFVRKWNMLVTIESIE
jgi:hypothetical protein